jgi:hypothetical protein
VLEAPLDPKGVLAEVALKSLADIAASQLLALTQLLHLTLVREAQLLLALV